MARPKKTEASVAIEKRLREMEKDKPKVYNIMDDGKFGQKITGQRFTQCAACGVEFEQNIAWDYHRYSTWKTCPSCRSKLAQRSFQAQKAKESGSTYAIPYEPLEWQKEAYEEFKKHRFQVLACGVRAG
jgi:hypothetical protein